MTELTVSPLYAALIAIIMAVLSTYVGILRGKYGVALGSDGKRELALNVRRFGNLSEYAAMAVLLLILLELKGIEHFWLNAYGITLVILRLLHPVILFDTMDAPIWKKVGRFVSAGGTAGLMLAAAVILIIS